jgi:O-antigen/teichoic acid export membrane protein
MLPTFLAVAAFPALARTLKIDPHTGRRLLRGAVKISLMGAIPLSFIGILFGDSIMLTLFGGAYAPAILTFKILMASLVIVFPSSIIGNAIFAYDAERFFVGIVGLAIFGNIFWNALLIPTLGIEGAAYATLLTQLMTNGIMWFKLKKLFAPVIS